MRGPSPWNDDLDARLTSDWAAGFSTAEIGRRMGVSKNSVIGRAHRLQLPSRGSPINLSQAQAIPWTEEDDALLTRIGFSWARPRKNPLDSTVRAGRDARVHASKKDEGKPHA